MGNCSSSESANALSQPGEFDNVSTPNKKRSGMSEAVNRLTSSIGFKPALEEPFAPIGIDVVVYEPLNIIIAKALAKNSPPFAVDCIYAVGTSADASTGNAAKAGKKSIYYFIRVKVKNDNGKIRKFTIYRRYSQFEQLNKDLVAGKKYPAVPKFPKKALFTSTNANLDAINMRKADLNKWLSLVATRITNIYKDPVFQAFITNSAVEIDYSDQISDLNQILCVFLPEDEKSPSGGFNTTKSTMSGHDGRSDGVSSGGDGDDDSDSEGSNELEAFIDVDFAMELIPQPNEETEEMLEEFSKQPIISATGATGGGGGGSNSSSSNSSSDPSLQQQERQAGGGTVIPPRNISYDYDRVVSFGKSPEPTATKAGAVTITYMVQVTYTDELTGRRFQVMTFKRYSEFTALRTALTKAYSASTIPSLPPKNLFGSHTNTDVEKMIERRSKLNIWLRDITTNLPNIKSNPAYYAFMTAEPNNIPQDYSVHMSLLANSRASLTSMC